MRNVLSVTVALSVLAGAVVGGCYLKEDEAQQQAQGQQPTLTYRAIVKIDGTALVSTRTGERLALNPGMLVTAEPYFAVNQPGNVVVTASGDGITIATRASALLRSGLQFSGSVSSRYAGDTVEIERAGPRTDGAWVGTTQGTVASDGTFTALWQTNHIGRFAVKAILTAPGGAAAASSSGGPTVTVTVYRPSVATLYGPGFWGRRTACGVVLRRYTVGVANRTLPCGTPVAAGTNTICTATVTDAGSSSQLDPAGTVAFTSGSGTFIIRSSAGFSKYEADIASDAGDLAVLERVESDLPGGQVRREVRDPIARQGADQMLVDERPAEVRGRNVAEDGANDAIRGRRAYRGRGGRRALRCRRALRG